MTKSPINLVPHLQKIQPRNSGVFISTNQRSLIAINCRCGATIRAFFYQKDFTARTGALHVLRTIFQLDAGYLIAIEILYT